MKAESSLDFLQEGVTAAINLGLQLMAFARLSA